MEFIERPFDWVDGVFLVLNLAVVLGLVLVGARLMSRWQRNR